MDLKQCVILGFFCVVILVSISLSGMGMVSIGILGPEGEGIKLTCRSSGWFPHPELQWLIKDNQSHPFELKQDHDQSFSVFSSITVLRGTTEVTCLVHVRSHLQMKQKSTMFLSQKRKYSMKRCFEEEEKFIQASQKETLESENLDLHRRLERARTEFDFRKAQSYLVHVHLDPCCKHPDLTVSADCSKAQHNLTSSEASATPGALIVVGKEGFGEGKQYWQVGVWDKPDWELGVLTETTKAGLKKQVFDALQEGYWSLKKSNEKYHPEEADREIGEFSVKPQMIGVYLDCEDHTLSFYSINSMIAIVKIPMDTSEKLYPFFSPGHSKVGDKVEPLSICHNRDWDFPSQLGQQNLSRSSSNDEEFSTD
ncbi:zinc-binding protein A33-like isoform X2 [Eublepharis macularius]|uniref:Zinc-binding protein A33-like isoform X2 n=1 Tax=Eublepharis macularius TaxID=481883 RepID=A0AA97LDZ1_EUBMA|nr:zinc-binding protein A33-like isoform X2 [Eublepharis macularius]